MRTSANRLAVTIALPHHQRVRITVLGLDKRTSHRIVSRASLIMSNLRTKGTWMAPGCINDGPSQKYSSAA